MSPRPARRTPRPPVALVGWGRMGRWMGRRLRERGYPVRVHDASPEACRDAETVGAEVVESAAAAATQCRFVITMLPDPQTVHAVATAADGLLDGLDPGTVWLEMSSSHPEVTSGLDTLARERSAELLDAPVSGGVAGARDGTLTIMVGGSAATLDRARGVLEVLGERVVHVGTRPGDGDLAKTINNMLSAINLTAAAEGLALGLKHGLEMGPLLETITGSSGASHATQFKIPRYVLTGTFDAGFTIRQLLKDLRIAQDVAAADEAPTHLRALVHAMWLSLAAEGHGDEDHTAVVQLLAARAGVDLPAAIS